jgi:hypothetical protein
MPHQDHMQGTEGFERYMIDTNACSSRGFMSKTAADDDDDDDECS